MHTYTDLCLAHPLESWTPFDIVVNSAYALLTMPVTFKPTSVINSPFIRYSGTSAYNIHVKVVLIGCESFAICAQLRSSRFSAPVLKFAVEIPGESSGPLEQFHSRLFCANRLEFPAVSRQHRRAAAIFRGATYQEADIPDLLRLTRCQLNNAD